MVKIKIDQDNCIVCGACVDICSPGVFSGGSSTIDIIAVDKCNGCGHCVALCPEDAIDHTLFPLEKMPKIEPGQTIDENLLSIMRGRRSVRDFKARPVEPEALQELIDASRWAPSATNAQDVGWLIVDQADDIMHLSRVAVSALAKLAKMVRFAPVRWALSLAYNRETLEKAVDSADQLEEVQVKLDSGENPLLFNAPVVLIAHVPKHNYFGRDDSIYAVYNLMLKAQSMGLGTCQIGFFTVALDRSKRLRKELGLPENRKAEVVLVLGYPRHKFRRFVDRKPREIIKFDKLKN